MIYRNVYKNKYLMNDKLIYFKLAGALALMAAAVTLTVTLNSKERAEVFLKEHNFTNIEVGGYNFFCVKGTPLRRKFVAKDSTGQDVEGSFCANRLILSDSIETTPIKVKLR